MKKKSTENRVVVGTSQVLLHMSDAGKQALQRVKQEFGCVSNSEAVEWVLLCQFHSAAEARGILESRRKRGERPAAE